MAEYFTPIMCMQPIAVRRNFEDKQLMEYLISDIIDVAPTVTDIRTVLHVKQNSSIKNLDRIFRLCLYLENGDFAVFGCEKNSIWGIVTWK